MIDVVHQKCKEDNCSIRPSFNFATEIIGIYCGKHKKENMIDVVSPKCKEENCNTIPSFNLETEKKGIYCGKHKKEK